MPWSDLADATTYHGAASGRGMRRPISEQPDNIAMLMLIGAWLMARLRKAPIFPHA